MFDITRWDPVQEMISLREAMNRLLEESMLPSRSIGSSVQETGQLTSRTSRMLGAPAIDIQDQDDAFIVRASLPGVQPEEVHVEARGNQVSISGQVREEHETERGNYLVRERRGGQFFRSFTLPVEVNSENAEASFTNGVLTLRLPKSEVSRARQIPIRAESTQRTGNGQTQAMGPGQGQAQAIGPGQGQTSFEQSQRQNQFGPGQGQPPFEQGQGRQQVQG